MLLHFRHCHQGYIDLTWVVEVGLKGNGSVSTGGPIDILGRWPQLPISASILHRSRSRPHSECALWHLCNTASSRNVPPEPRGIGLGLSHNVNGVLLFFLQIMNNLNSMYPSVKYLLILLSNSEHLVEDEMANNCGNHNGKRPASAEVSFCKLTWTCFFNILRWVGLPRISHVMLPSWAPVSPVVFSRIWRAPLKRSCGWWQSLPLHCSWRGKVVGHWKRRWPLIQTCHRWIKKDPPKPSSQLPRHCRSRRQQILS